MYGQLQGERRRPAQDPGSGRVYGRLGDAAALALPELAAVPRLLRGAGRRWVALLVAGVVALTAAVAVVIFVWNAANETTARQATTRFGATLVHNDPNAAPPGAADYVSGVRAYFGAVSSAQLIGSHQKAVGHEPDTRSFYVAELLLRTRRGPAVVEVEFDNDSINSDRVSSVYELAPGSAPGLSAGQRAQLTAAFNARGNKPADATTLALAASKVASQTSSSTAASAPAATSAPSATSAPAAASDPTVNAAKRLRCVRAAHHDVTKLARCTQ
jgi:hypothetical protein